MANRLASLTFEHDSSSPVTLAPGGIAGGLIALTEDPALVDTLGAALDGVHAFLIVASDRDLTDHLMRSGASTALVDSAASALPIAELCERLSSQFPDLVLVVAGTAAEQVALAPLVTNGRVYRFVQKPASAQRLRVSIESALRRHDSAPAVAAAPSVSSTPFATRSDPRLAIVGLALASLAAIAIWWFMREPDAPKAIAIPDPVAPVMSDLDPATNRILERADSALANAQLLAPPGESAVDLYRQVLAKTPSNARAADGLDQVVDALLVQAEAAIVAENLDEAERLVLSARAVRADHPRVAFLTAQIGKERERALLGEARKAAASGNLSRALAVLDGAQSAGSSPLLSAAKQEFEQQDIANRVANILALADERIGSGALLEPAQDNARFFVGSALALAPTDPAALAARKALRVALLANARAAIATGNFPTAESSLAAAADSGATRDEMAAIRNEMQQAAGRQQTEGYAALAQRFDTELRNRSLIDPPGSNAKATFSQMLTADAGNPQTAAARSALGGAYLQQARLSLARSDIKAAEGWVAEATAIGVSGAEVESVNRAMTTVRDLESRASQVISAAQLKRVRTVDPRYPTAAREAAQSGWVDLEFTVAPDGSVTEMEVTNANPKGVFDASAVDAVGRWRFRPVERNGVAVAQRARLRIRFDME